MTSSAKMPTSVRSPYRNVALVRLTPKYAAGGELPKMLSARARGVEAIEHLGHHYVGKTARAAYQTTLAYALAVARSRNAPDDSPLRSKLERSLLDYVKIRAEQLR
jgi:hypothetical protein